MYISAGKRHGCNPNTCPRELYSTRIISAGHHAFCLYRYTNLLRRPENSVIQRFIIKCAVIHKGNHRTLADTANLLVRIYARRICGSGRFHYHCNIGAIRMPRFLPLSPTSS